MGRYDSCKNILRIFTAKGVKPLLCAPTGRAAKRLGEAPGFEAKTIHRLLEVDPRSGGFKRDTGNPLDCDVLVVDETSMVDVMLMQALPRAVPDKSRAADRRRHRPTPLGRARPSRIARGGSSQMCVVAKADSDCGELLQQSLGLLEHRRVEAFGEPVVDRR